MLAAGSSTRMGRSKQLLQVGNTTLLRHTVQVATSVSHARTIVVLGARENLHRAEIKDLPVEVAHNQNWETGIGSSIKVGAKHVSGLAHMAGVIILVCDQPHVDVELLNNLIASHEKCGKLIVASAYANTIGVPALFDISLLQKLLGLENEQGAKALFTKYQDKLETVAFAKGAIDLDTEEDYDRFIQQ